MGRSAYAGLNSEITCVNFYGIYYSKDVNVASIVGVITLEFS